VRYEYDGTKTVIADKFEGKRFNAPNDAVVHPNGDIWFTDPGYGSLMHYEGQQGRVGTEGSRLSHRREDRQDRQGHRRTLQAQRPLLLARLQEALRRRHRREPSQDAPKNIKVWDVVDDRSLADGKEFASMMLDDKAGFADGIRCDTDGNIWASAGWVGDGYDGVHVFAPDGTRIGQILLPEIGSNVCFGGPKRNRLFITAGQSLYAVYVEAIGAHIA
jgi:gluconolactonase